MIGKLKLQIYVLESRQPFSNQNATVPSITIKNVPDELHQKLKRISAANHRSINAEIIHILSENLEEKIQLPSLTEIRSLRTMTARNYLTEAEIEKLKAEGRS